MTETGVFIRDLLFSIIRLNEIFIENEIPIVIFASVRSEVLRSVYEIGQELSRDVRDFEVRLSWDFSGSDDVHPLLNLITRRIEISEQEMNFTSRKTTTWEYYFPATVQLLPIKKYILHNSFYRPRDLVRLLTLAQKFNPISPKFEHQMFDRTVKDFSEETWGEIIDELLAAYSINHIRTIKSLFKNQRPYFTYNDFEGMMRTGAAKARTETEKKTYDFLINRSPATILEDLYRIGAVGNVKRTGENRWVFRGDMEPDFEDRFQVHRALWRHFEVNYRGSRHDS